MKSPNKLLIHVAVACLFAVLIAFGMISVAKAGTDPQGLCVANSGSWSGPNASNGTCTYPIGTAVADFNCGGTANYEVTYVAGAQTADQCLLFTTPASPEGDCTSASGTWSGADSDNGDCTFAEGNSTAVFFCGSGYEYSVTYVAGTATSSQCSFVGTSSNNDGATGSDGDEARGDSDKPVTLTLGSGQNGSATFPPGSCPQKCTISKGLPSAAKGGLPSDAMATMYVRVVNEGGNPGTGTYTVCFKNPEGQAVKIYRFVGGVWVLVTATTSNPICTTASGDGAFYLGN